MGDPAKPLRQTVSVRLSEARPNSCLNAQPRPTVSLVNIVEVNPMVGEEVLQGKLGAGLSCEIRDTPDQPIAILPHRLTQILQHVLASQALHIEDAPCGQVGKSVLKLLVHFPAWIS